MFRTLALGREPSCAILVGMIALRNGAVQGHLRLRVPFGRTSSTPRWFVQEIRK